ncbi:hypothetical protein [Prevotella sp. P6B1]|uniref:hypothetical protein n=1 Tax=Prevotella sp. P6B1 TaxID=1410613 RepID=UPI00051C3B83|nr:hypothetical protein [Prevotella sp. P6B1]
MKEILEKEQSFLGQFYTQNCWGDLRQILEVWRQYLNEPNHSAKFKDWDNLEFAFSSVFKRKNVYYDLARMIAYGWFKERKIARICEYLAKHTNLDDNQNMFRRKENIRHGIYGQINHFKKEREQTKKDESLIITTQQGFTTTKRIA